MLVDVDPTTITRNTIAARVINISRLLLILLDVNQLARIGRSIVAHDIVIPRHLLIISIRITPFMALRQRDEKKQTSEIWQSKGAMRKKAEVANEQEALPCCEK